VVWDGVIVPRERITHAVVYDGGQVLSVPAGD
jgi:hypothetical protein